MTVPPNIGSHRPGDLAGTLRLAWRNRGLDVRTVGDVTRLMTMSIADLLDDWFESPQVKGALAVNGVIGTWAGPYEPGTAYVMAHHSIGDVGDGQLGSWGFPEGGMGGVSAAIRRSAESFGAEIRTDARVERLLVRGGRVQGAVLADGTELRAPVVVTSLHPKTAFLDHVGRAELPDDFVRDIERWRSRSGVVKVNLALGELPDFTADPAPSCRSTTPVRSRWRQHGVHRARLPGRARGPAGRAAVLRRRDPDDLRQVARARGRAHHVAVHPVGAAASGARSRTQEELEAYADRCIDLYDEVAPNFKASILHRDVVGPYEMEHEYGLIGGNIFHGELSLEQLFHMRPAPGYADYRTPVAGLYNAARRRTPAAASAASPACRRPPALAIGDRKRAPRHGECPACRAAAIAGDIERGSVRAMLEARSVAIVGASARPGSFGERLVDRGHAQPERADASTSSTRGTTRCSAAPASTALDDVAGPVDLVLLGVGDAAVEDSSRRRPPRRPRGSGVRLGLVRRRRQDEPRWSTRLAAIARDGWHGLVRRGLHGFRQRRQGVARDRLSRARPDLPPGPVAFVSATRARRSRRCCAAIAASASRWPCPPGQELVTTTADYLDYALDPSRDPGRRRCCWRPCASRAAARGTGPRRGERHPVVLLAVGGSPPAPALVSAHSGALAGSDAAWEALVEAHGLLRVEDLDEMADLLELLATGRRACTAGRSRVRA